MPEVNERYDYSAVDDLYASMREHDKKRIETPAEAKPQMSLADKLQRCEDEITRASLQLAHDTRIKMVDMRRSLHYQAAQEIITALRIQEACIELLDADHHDHFASRMSDSELAALEKIKKLLNR